MKHLIILTALFCIGIANAQQQKDVVYLKNGSVIKGTITEVNPGSNLKIETANGSLFVFEMDEIERTTKETVTSSANEVTRSTSEKEVIESQESSTSKPTYDSDKTTLGKLSVGFQPAGFLQYGPVIDLGFRVGKKSVIGPHFRYASLGLAYNAINEFGNTFLCFGGGVSFKHFPAEHQKNKFYYGISVDLLFEEFSPDEDYDYYTNTLSLIAMPNAGYRFRFGSGFYINLGLFAGLYFDMYDQIPGFWGCAEFALGVEF